MFVICFEMIIICNWPFSIQEAQQLPKIGPVNPPIDPTALPADTPKPTKFPPVTQTTLKPTTTCNCGPTTFTSFSTWKSSTGRTTTSKPPKPWPSVDLVCERFEKPAEMLYYNLCKPPGSHTLNLFSVFKHCNHFNKF